MLWYSFNQNTYQANPKAARFKSSTQHYSSLQHLHCFLFISFYKWLSWYRQKSSLRKSGGRKFTGEVWQVSNVYNSEFERITSKEKVVIDVFTVYDIFRPCLIKKPTAYTTVDCYFLEIDIIWCSILQHGRDDKPGTNKIYYTIKWY